MSVINNPFGVNETRRFVSSGAEKLLYVNQNVLDHGQIELVDYMGGDETVERVATMGHGKGIFKENPGSSEFIQHLESKGIYEPFTSVQLKFSFQTSIATALTLVYNPSASVNEYSGRYSVMLESAFIPSFDQIRSKLEGDENKKSLRADEIRRTLLKTREEVKQNYDGLIKLDLARELARSALGTDNDTRYFWKTDLLSLANLVTKQRKLLDLNDPTFDYIECLAEIAEKTAPESWRSLMNSHRNKKLPLIMPKDEVIVDDNLGPALWSPSQTKRPIAEKLEELLFVGKPLLNHGSVQAVDYMGNDSSFAEAARTSYGRETKTLSDDAQLIKSLIRDLHTSPIEMAELAFESKAPMFVDPRQAGRHRTLDKHGFMGYFPKGSQFYVQPSDEFKYQDRKNRQGRGKEMDPEHLEKAIPLVTESFKIELDAVQRLRALDAPEDIIRDSKGVGFYTKVWRTGDTHNLANYLRLRLDKHAQKEIRDQAGLISNLHQAHTPIAHEAHMIYSINGMRLSEKEVRLFRDLVSTGKLHRVMKLEDIELYKGVGFVVPIDKTDHSKGKKLTREGEDFKSKLGRILES